jgi:hypothetical protein
MYQSYQQNYQAPINLLTRVTGIEGARAYQMPPNSVVPLFDGGEDVFYVKSTDGAGFPTIRAFRFEEIQQQPAQTDYVTHDEFAALSQKIDKLMEALGGTDGQ